MIAPITVWEVTPGEVWFRVIKNHRRPVVRFQASKFVEWLLEVPFSLADAKCLESIETGVSISSRPTGEAYTPQLLVSRGTSQLLVFLNMHRNSNYRAHK
jgi:hypothetical protein